MKSFHPIESVFIPASLPHPENSQYRISIGTEFFDNVPHKVIMIQMVYNGRIEGRKSPSFPIGTDDLMRVSTAANELFQKNMGENEINE